MNAYAVATIARGLTERQRATLAWAVEDHPYGYRGSPHDDVAGLVALGLMGPTTEDAWGAVTPLGHVVWKLARPTWAAEHAMGAAYRKRPVVHVADEECTVGKNGTCDTCGVSHGEPCATCGGRGFHKQTCTESEASS